MCTTLRLEYIFILNQKELIHVRAHYHQFRSPLPVRTLYRSLLTLYMEYFFLYPRDWNIIKENKLRVLTFIMFIKKHQFFNPPAPPSAKISNRSLV